GVAAQAPGRHARAVAWVARRLDLQATVVVPEATRRPKLEAVRALGARVESVPDRERDQRAAELVAEHGSVHVPPYDDLRIIAGQGTVGLELVEQLPGVDVALVPVSGGGLICGMGTAVKS